MVAALLGIAQKVKWATVWVIIDDGLGKKDKATRHLEAVDFQHNHNDGTSKGQAFVNGFVNVEVDVPIGQSNSPSTCGCTCARRRCAS